MRSISYILGGKPSNTADCLNYAAQHPPQGIMLMLKTPEQVAEEFTVRWLKGSFVWVFDDVNVAYEVLFGGCFMHESQERQRLSVDKANSRLVRELETINTGLQDVGIKNDESRFDYSSIYAK